MQTDLAPQPSATATALAARYYVEPSMAGVDRSLVFDRAWQLVAHVSQLRDAGDHVVADLAGLPVIAVRGEDAAIRVFHNVCRHRGLDVVPGRQRGGGGAGLRGEVGLHAGSIP
ncbi:MAG: hypothetical protein EOP93_13080 [Lysobacteraceae bacterium]|nr:MAG: hypothetical protein EOP93_13080 [Xanthomonadaceae bacterium]